MNAGHWFKLAAQLLNEQNKYKAFILLQGTDTLAWTAAALDCLLVGFPSPLILTASQRPLNSSNSDALANITFALEQALQLKAGCYIAFAGELLPAKKTRKLDSESFKAFAATDKAPVKNHFWPPSGQLSASELYLLADNFRPKLLRLPLIPSLNDAWLARQLEGLDGLILEGLGSGNAPPLPLTFKRLTELRQTQCLPIGLISQCWQGGVNQQYAASAALQQTGLLALGKMTPEYAEARLVCLLALKRLNKITATEVYSYWFDN